MTGGLVAARLTAVPGASDVFLGSVVSYATEVKRDVLGVDAELVVSEDAARQMAEGVRRTLSADIGIALTGVAGPTEQEGRPVGTLVVAVSGGGCDLVRSLRLPGQREQVRQFAVINSLDLLRGRLLA